MAIGITIFIIATLIAAIWVIIEIKRMKHKIFAIFLIGLILFAYITFTVSLRGEDVELTTIPGLIDAGKIYFSWISTSFIKMKDITAYAIGLDWKEKEIENLNEDYPPQKDNKSIWEKLK